MLLYNLRILATSEYLVSIICGSIINTQEETCYMGSVDETVLEPNLFLKAVEGLSLALQCVHNIHGGDSLSPGVFRVSNSVSDDILEKQLQNSASFFIDETSNALDTTATSQSADSGLCDALDVVSENLSVAFGPTFAQSLSVFSFSRS